MTAFYFAVADNDGVIGSDDAFDFPDMSAAVDQAKVVLAEMALDGLPVEPTRALSIEVQAADRTPIVRMTLELRIQYMSSLR